MKLNRVILSAIALSILLFAGCKKEEPISNVPSIRFVSLSPNPAIKNTDPVTMVIEYTDGDGDLGENLPDVKNMFVTDNRNNVTYEFRIPQLAPNDAGIIIRGNLNINLNPQGFVDDNNSTEQVVFSVFVKDRSGNQSNTITSEPLTVNAQ